MNKKIIKEIDAAIQYVWKYDIAKDYADVDSKRNMKFYVKPH